MEDCKINLQLNFIYLMKMIQKLQSMGLEAELTTVDTLLDELGASIGNNSCSVVVPREGD